MVIFRAIHPHPQRLAAAGVLLLGMLFVGCKAPQATAQSETTPVAPVATQVKAPAQSDPSPSPEFPSILKDKNSGHENPDLGGAIKQGLSYTELTKSMSDHGWASVVNPQCQANMVGASYQKVCARKPEPESCSYCKDMPGLNQCSSSGDCLFTFRHADENKMLEVAMGNEIDNWRVKSPDAMFTVYSWRDPKQVVR